MEYERDWFRSIYNRYRPLLWVIASRKNIPENDIDDVVQETFFRYTRAYPDPKPENETKRLLATILRNLCVDYYRSRNAHPMKYMEEENLQQKRNLDVQMENDVLQLLLVKQGYEELLQALRSMREDWLCVFRLYIMQEKPMEEVSRILGISSNACRMRLMRGRKYLKKRMED